MNIDGSKVEWKAVVAPLSGRWAPLYWGVFHLSTRLIWEAIAIGDTANPVIPDWLGASLTVLNFPMFYLWFPFGEWLKSSLTDDGVQDLFTAIDALFWTHILVWLASRIGARRWLVVLNVLFSIPLVAKLCLGTSGIAR